ncbi:MULTISPECIES: DUF805 domain-containing protein [Streptococcus]|uniref:DUF805 domain-containing protein n=1 Tax=Streptococcus caledonicus TaxID=2614158 RepID=A0ABW0UDS0_9STRE|nr:DUF805 domain-containing protein [Streptococcus sp. S784/96/1]
MFRAYKNYWLNYANFEGKSKRADFWWVVLCNFLISLPFALVGFFLFFFNIASIVASDPMAFEYMSNEESVVFAFEMFSSIVPILIIFIIWWLATLIPNLALEVRRYRDAGLSWAFIFLNLGALLAFVPVIGWLVSLGFHIARLVLLVQPSKAVHESADEETSYWSTEPLQSDDSHLVESSQSPVEDTTFGE